MFTTFFFWYCALVILGCGLLAINLRNPVHSVLSVLVLFFHLAGLYLLLQAEFLAAVQVIVYAGAILVLYLFVLFLINLKEELKLDAFVPGVKLGRGIAVGLFVLLLWALPSFTAGQHGQWTSKLIEENGHVQTLGLEIFTQYLLPFEIAGVILLMALIGGLVLAAKIDRPADNKTASVPEASGQQMEKHP